MASKFIPGTANQQGAALMTALLLLIVITLLSLTSMRSSMMEVRMAGNEQERMAAFQSAQSAIDLIVSDRKNFPVTSGEGFVLCSTNWSQEDCNQKTLELSETPFTDGNQVGVRRQDPDLIPMPRGLNTSADKFFAATFAVHSYVDKTGSGGGKSKIVQGYLRAVPKSGQSN